MSMGQRKFVHSGYSARRTLNEYPTHQLSSFFTLSLASYIKEGTLYTVVPLTCRTCALEDLSSNFSQTCKLSSRLFVTSDLPVAVCPYTNKLDGTCCFSYKQRKPGYGNLNHASHSKATSANSCLIW